MGSEAEGCAVDDDNAALYVSEEDVALWRYDAYPAGGGSRVAVDRVVSAGGHLAPDIEGVTVVTLPDGSGYVIASAQNLAAPTSSYFTVYERQGTNSYVKSFRVVAGTAADDCDRTDGVAATAAGLGPAFPQGMFVCQDNHNSRPGSTGNQNLKLVPLQAVVPGSQVQGAS